MVEDHGKSIENMGDPSVEVGLDDPSTNTAHVEGEFQEIIPEGVRNAIRKSSRKSNKSSRSLRSKGSRRMSLRNSLNQASKRFSNVAKKQSSSRELKVEHRDSNYNSNDGEILSNDVVANDSAEEQVVLSLDSTDSMKPAASTSPKPKKQNWFTSIFDQVIPAATKSNKEESKNEGPEYDMGINVNGILYIASSICIRNHNQSILCKMLEDPSYPRDDDGNLEVEYATSQFQRLLDYVHFGTCEMPNLASDEWVELRFDAHNFNIEDLLSAIEAKEAVLQEREREKIRIAMLRLEYERTKQRLQAKRGEKKYAFNILVAGVTGTGKSSSLNTILDSQACMVSGGQAQGTRGTVLRDGVIDDKHFMSYIDTQGLGADTSVSDAELMAQIMTSAESIRSMGIINNVLLSFDTSARTTPTMMANQLTLMELFNEIKRSCFLCFTKWNTNSVMAEWNTPLKKWIRKWRKANDISEITANPPSYQEMYVAYCKYLIKFMLNGQDGGAFAKMVTFLSFFESRVVWMYNLDSVQIEDMEDGVLDPHIYYLYRYYRTKSLEVLRQGSTIIKTKDLIFLKGSKDTMLGVAKSLVRMRNRKITQLELIGLQKDKRQQLKEIFLERVPEIAQRISDAQYDSSDDFTNEIAALAGVTREGAYVGCAMQ